MENQQEWLLQKQLRIEELTSNFSISKFNLLKISYLDRLLEESSKHTATCNECHDNLKILEQLIEEIPHLELIDHREPYERQFNAIRRHFHQTHGFIAPYHFTAIYTLWGLMAILLPAMLWSHFIQGRLLTDVSLAAAAIGLIFGYLLGARKEGRYRRTKKII